MTIAESSIVHAARSRAWPAKSPRVGVGAVAERAPPWSLQLARGVCTQCPLSPARARRTAQLFQRIESAFFKILLELLLLFCRAWGRTNTFTPLRDTRACQRSLDFETNCLKKKRVFQKERVFRAPISATSWETHSVLASLIASLRCRRPAWTRSAAFPCAWIRTPYAARREPSSDARCGQRRE